MNTTMPREQYRTAVRQMVGLMEDIPLPMTAFEMRRGFDETGKSLRFCDNAEGIVLEGLVYTGGAVGVRWRTDYWSVVFYPDWKSFVTIHIGAHPSNDTFIRFYPKLGQPYEWSQSGRHEIEPLARDVLAVVEAVKHDGK